MQQNHEVIIKTDHTEKKPIQGLPGLLSIVCKLKFGLHLAHEVNPEKCDLNTALL